MIISILKMSRLPARVVALLCCSIISVHSLLAQEMKHPFYVYLSGGGGIGSHSYGFVELRTVFLKHHGINVGYSGFSKKYNSIPDDYNGIGVLGTVHPHESLEGVTITYSYLLYSDDERISPKLRYPFSIGALIGSCSKPGNFQRQSPIPFIPSPNYSYEDVSNSSVALLMRAGLEFTPGRVFGLNAGAFMVVGDEVGGGVYAGIMLGRVGSHITKRHRERQGG